MNTLQKFNIKEKMILGYMPILLAIIAIAVFSLQSLNQFERINKDIVENDTVLLLTTDKLVDNLLAQEAYGRRHMILGSPQMLELFRQRSHAFDSLMDQIRALPKRKNIPIEQLASLHYELNELYTKNFASLNNSAAGPVPRYDNQIQGKLDEILVLIQRIEKVGWENQHQKIVNASTIGMRTFRITGLLSVLGFILGFVAISLISRSISRSIQQLKSSAKLISEGHFDHYPNVGTKDEFRELASSFGDMAQRLAFLEVIHRDANPLTRLPGGTAIEDVLKNSLATNKNISFCMLDLDNFKSFNDRYGYAQGNEIIKATAELIKSTVSRYNSDDNFVGHIGGDDFVAIVNQRHHRAICETIIKEFDRMVPNYYNVKDRKKGYIVGNTRQGLEVRFPIMTISIAVVNVDPQSPTSHLIIGEIAAELKEHAKSIQGSVFVVNRRGQKKQQPGFRPKLVGQGGK